MHVLLGRYEYVAELGQGSGSRVLHARDLAAGGAARALKIVSPEQGARLSWELSRLSEVAHPNVARVRELLRVEESVHAPFALVRGAWVLVMDLAQGEPADRALEPVRDDPRALLASVFRIALGGAEALTALHRAGLVHGDVKPANLLCTRGEKQVTLIDLGAARAPGFYSVLDGTPDYLAPEAWAGTRSFAQDVYALGATLFDLLQGDLLAQPSEPSLSPWRVRDVGRLAATVPSAFVDLLRRMLHVDPEPRPADATRLLAALYAVGKRLHLGVPRSAASFATGRILPSPSELSTRALNLPFVGQRALREELTLALQVSSVIVLRGPAGSGRSRVLHEAVRVLQQQAAERGARPPSLLHDLEAALRTELPSMIVSQSASRPEDVARAKRAVRALRRTGRQLTVVIDCEPDPSLPVVTELATFEVGPLGPDDVGTLLARALDQEVSNDVVEVARSLSGGYAGRLCALLSAGLSAGRALHQPSEWSELLAEARDVTGLRSEAQRLLEALSLSSSELSAPLAERLLGGPQGLTRALQELRARGLVADGEEGGLELSADVARKVRTELGDRGAVLGAELAALLPPEHRSHWVCTLLGEHERAQWLVQDAVERLRRRGEVRAAVGFLREILPSLDREPLRILLADAQRALGHYAQAADTLSPCASAEASCLLAEVQRLMGRAELAAQTLEHLASANEPFRARARAIEARLCFDAGKVEQAQRLVQGLPSDTPARLRVREARVLLSSDPAARDNELRELLAEARQLGEGRALSRALMLAAQSEVRAGRFVAASEALAEALARSKDAGEVHEAASIAINLGLVELDAGQLGRALRSLREGTAALTLLGREGDLSRALYNLANAACLIGDLTLAEVTVAEARERAEAVTDPMLRRCLTVVESELALHRGALEPALRMLSEELQGNSTADLWCLVASRAVCAAVAASNLAAAEDFLSVARKACDPDDVGQVAERAVAEARLRLALGQATLAEQAVAAALELGGQRLSYETDLRLLFVAIDTARGTGLGEVAEARLLACRALLERGLSGLEADARAMFRALPAHARVLSQGVARPQSVETTQASRGRALILVARRLFQATSEARLARVSCQIALDLVQAERALLVRQASDGTAQVLARAALSESPEVSFSRSIVERVWSDMKSLATVDALHDARLDAAQSVHSLGVRSVVAVPVRGLGARCVLYLDDRLRAGAFGAAERELLEELSELIAIASRAVSAVRTERRVAQRAQRDLRSLEASLLRAPTSTVSSPLIGASRALHLTLQLARRVATTNTPVLIQGESGTGKELLARFVHAESERRDKPFVAESCAALPESLLESTLFGHERGAFTGADRARAGLFESADRGTLFLDEVAEMSPALQAKLLRVLQDGEVRPVGSDKTRHVDVRLVTATHRDLATMVREGRFRQDLFYRMAVVTLELPALRERLEDVPLLVEAFVQKHAPQRKVRVSARAMEALQSRDWPGNVRQLESEIQRALALAESVIDVEHLSPVPDEETTYGLDLRSHTDALQRKLVRRALDDCAGNQTRAAELLGISRFGLLKMLKRLGMQ